MTAARHFVLRLARSGPVRRLASPASARRPVTAGRALRLEPSAPPLAGYSSRGFSTLFDSEASEKYYKMVRAASAVLGLVTAVGGGLGYAGYYVIAFVNKGVDEKLQVDRDATAAKIEAERVRTEDFRTLATKTHLDTVRKLDDTVSDLRTQFNSLSVRCLEGKYLEAYYRSQIQKAQEVLDREGVTASSEVHVQLLPKINNLESQIALLTEELAMLKKLISGDVPSDGADSNALSNEPSQKESKANDGGGGGLGSP